MVQRARRAVVFTGAGISTECGIPDFRSPGGFWTSYKPIEFSDFMASEETRREAWRRFLPIRESLSARRGPAPVIAWYRELVRRGHVSHVITQNIDGLHAASGRSARPDHRDPRQRHLCDLPRLRNAPRDRLGAGTMIEPTGRAPACTAAAAS